MPKKNSQVAASDIHMRKWSLINDKIEEGVRWGLIRSRKHTETPSDEQIVDSIMNCVQVSLDEVIDWEK